MPTSRPRRCWQSLIDLLREQGVTFGVAEPTGRLLESLQRAGIDQQIGAQYIFSSVDEAVKAYLAAYPDAAARRGTPPPTA